MNVTAILMGDPPAHRSALYRRHEPVSITLATRDVGGGPPRLTEAIVREIRASEGSCRLLADKFGVGHQAISDIRSGRTWKYVT